MAGFGAFLSKAKEVAINSSNLFTFDNKFAISGRAVTSGNHTLEFKRKGKGPVYFNAYVSNFTLEDHITKAGLEIKVDRKYYKLTPVDKKVSVSGSRGQAVNAIHEGVYTADELNVFRQDTKRIAEVCTPLR